MNLHKDPMLREPKCERRRDEARGLICTVQLGSATEEKGANQALAAARAGGDVRLIGCVGEYDFGTRYIEHLHTEGIHPGAIMKTGPSTGCAFITFDEGGEKTVVSPGANHCLTPLHIVGHATLIRSAAALLLRLECPLPTVLHAIHIATTAGVPVILNRSPLTSEFIKVQVNFDLCYIEPIVGKPCWIKRLGPESLINTCFQTEKESAMQRRKTLKRQS
jgi:sugar/nucleoside kinase (ribokinase family)